MGIADYIALAVILFLIVCAARYIFASRKNGKCSGCCAQCKLCSEHNSRKNSKEKSE